MRAAVLGALMCGLPVLLSGCHPRGDSGAGETGDSDSGGCENPVTKAALMDLYAGQVCPLAPACQPDGWTEAECRTTYASFRDDPTLCVDECATSECAALIQAVVDCETYDAAVDADASYGLLTEECG